MNVFVAGGTGVLGRAAVDALREAGHRVRATARGEEKAGLVRSLGAEPIEVDLYDAAAVRRAVAGSDAVLRLTTKISSLMKMGKRGAWTETGRLRTVGARTLVDACILEQIPVYVHESVVYVYADGGAGWLDERAPTDDGGTTILRATLDGEQEAVRFTRAGGRGIVLRFGGFYAPDVPSTLETAQLVRRRMLPQIGSGTNYMPSIFIADAGWAVAAAVGAAPAGTYNVCDDAPVPYAEYLRVVVESLRAPRPWRLPAPLGRMLSVKQEDTSSARDAPPTAGFGRRPAGRLKSAACRRAGRGSRLHGASLLPPPSSMATGSRIDEGPSSKRRGAEMKTTRFTAQMLVRVCGLILVVLGVSFWTGHALTLIPVHRQLGYLFVLSLWTLAVLGAAADAAPRLVVLTVAWGLVVAALGMTQDRLLIGDAHWVIKVLHLLVGLGAIGQAEGLAARIKQAPTPMRQP